MLKIFILIYILIYVNSTCLDNKSCDGSCKTCRKPCDQNSCTSCYPKYYKLALEYWDTEFQCSKECNQSFSLPITGQRYRYCNISQPLNRDGDDEKIYDDFKPVDEISRAKVITNSDATNFFDGTFVLVSFICAAVILIATIFILIIFLFFKKAKMPRHNSSTEELIRKESEVTIEEELPKKKSEIKRDYLYIAGSTPKYSQLIIITNKNEFSIAQECNAGHFSKVHKGKFRNRDVAIKIAEDNGRHSIHTELKIYDKICHSNILSALAVYFGVKNMLFMPFRSCNLSQYFISYGAKITVSQLLEYSIQICDAMTYLHSLKIIHCDLKIDNILMKDSTGKNVEISDFGCAVDLMDEVSPCFTGTTTHAAYELLKSYILFETNKATTKTLEVFCSKKSDVWSFAITIWQIFQKSSKIPENFRSPNDIVKNYESGKPLSQPTLMPDYIYRYIILRCLDLDPKVRPSMSEIYEFLKFYHQKSISAKVGF